MAKTSTIDLILNGKIKLPLTRPAKAEELIAASGIEKRPNTIAPPDPPLGVTAAWGATYTAAAMGYTAVSSIRNTPYGLSKDKRYGVKLTVDWRDNSAYEKAARDCEYIRRAALDDLPAPGRVIETAFHELFPDVMASIEGPTNGPKTVNSSNT